MSRVIAVADIGGTNARFALARIDDDRAELISEPVTFATSDHATFGDAWRSFCAANPGPEPDSLGLAFAGPVDGGRARLTNNDWTIDRDSLAALGIVKPAIVNDFGAIAHAVAILGDDHFSSFGGAPTAQATPAVTTVLGPGTGLGVALIAHHHGAPVIVETEGGHIGFAPADETEDMILAKLRTRFGRVSAERLASGPGLANLHWALTGAQVDDRQLWTAVLGGSDPSALATFERWSAILGAVAGDIALAHGAESFVLAGGLGYRLRAILPASRFAERFASKGRYEERMRKIPTRILTHPQPGLLGAAIAFQKQW